MEYYLLVFFISGLTLSASRDKLKQHWNISIFKYWLRNSSWVTFFEPLSWRNKYQKDKDGKLIPHPTKPGKYLRKKMFGIEWLTLPVIFTNAWHLIKGMEILVWCIVTALGLKLTWIEWLHYFWYNLIALILIWSILFELIHGSFLERESDE